MVWNNRQSFRNVAWGANWKEDERPWHTISGQKLTKLSQNEARSVLNNGTSMLGSILRITSYEVSRGVDDSGLQVPI